MRLRVFRSPWAALLCLLAVLTAPSSAIAQEGQWLVEHARLLLSEGWEAGIQLEEPAVIGYALHFVELERSAVQRLGLDLDLGTGEGPGLWFVAGRDLGLSFEHQAPFALSAQLEAKLGGSKERTSLDSWLLTMDGRPLQMNVAQTEQRLTAGQGQEQKLEITIFPLGVGDKQVESEIQIFYQIAQGRVAQLETTLWVSEEPGEPIAIISRQGSSGRRGDWQYFAVYVSGAPLSPELIPEESPFLAMGSVEGLRQFLAGTPEPAPAELGFALSRGEEDWGWQVDASLPVGSRHKVYGEFRSVPQTKYVLGLEGAVREGLHFLAEVGGGNDQKPSLRLGVRDELLFGQNLRLSAALLPFSFNFENWRPEAIFNWRVKAEFLQENYSIWYQADNDSQVIRHSLGLAAFTSGTVGAKLSWSWDEENGSVLTAGIQVRF